MDIDQEERQHLEDKKQQEKSLAENEKLKALLAEKNS